MTLKPLPTNRTMLVKVGRQVSYDNHKRNFNWKCDYRKHWAMCHFVVCKYCFEEIVLNPLIKVLLFLELVYCDVSNVNKFCCDNS